MSDKRLFLFASYDKSGIIDDSLLHYLKSLSVLGDIIFVMDNNTSDEMLSRVTKIPNVLYANATRHGEYDFGSYKRAYLYAHDNKLLNKYDWVYLVNDSVYGPLFDMSNILTDLESRDADLIGMVDFRNSLTPVHVQSWFVGIRGNIARSDFVYDFMRSIRAQENKQLIVLKYEVGLSQLLLKHGCKMSTWISGQDGESSHGMYACPIEMLQAGVPFLKKNALNNLGGFQFLYPYTSELMVDYIHKNAVRNNLSCVDVSRVAPIYRKCFRLTLLSIPIVSIYRQRHDDNQRVCYKFYMFDFIPVGKIFLQK